MAQFFTEIPVSRNVSVSDFVNLVVEWIGGVARSTVFSADSKAVTPDFDQEYVKVEGRNGESFELRRLTRDDETYSIGFRYELPDDSGRLWRTESVLHSTKTDAFLTVRVVCLSNQDGAHIIPPKRPYVLKLVLKAGWGASDGSIQVSDSPRYLDRAEVELARQAVSGTASILLPVIYVSSASDDETAVNASNLAYMLGGVAHVLVEPSRDFSLSLREVAEGKNPYGGAIGVSLPERPNVVRFVPTREHHQMDAERLKIQLLEFVSSKVTRFGLDWYLLQEESARKVRQELSKNVGVNENELFEQWSESFGSELAAKDQENAQLRETIKALQARSVSNMSSAINIVDNSIIESRLPQVYDGEVADRVARLLDYVSDNPAGLFGHRDLHVYAALSALLPKSSAGAELKERLKIAGSDSKKSPKKIGDILEQLGFTKNDDGKHIKFTPPPGMRCVGQVVMAKTPSDHRAGKNNVSIVCKALGIS